MSIIHITGIPGSGKTWICHQLRGVICYDLDDVLSDVYHNLRQKNARLTFQTIDREAKKRVAELVTKHRKAGTHAVFVGVTILVPQADYVYFIRMTQNELKVAYRRVIAREIDKIVTNAASLKQIVTKAPLESIDKDLAVGYHVEALNITTPFSRYKQIYTEASRAERARGLLIRSQSQILDEIRMIFTEN